MNVSITASPRDVMLAKIELELPPRVVALFKRLAAAADWLIGWLARMADRLIEALTRKSWSSFDRQFLDMWGISPGTIRPVAA